MAFVLDQKLRPYATARQWEILCAVEKHGSRILASKKLGLNEKAAWKSERAVLRKAAMHGYAPDHDLRNPCAPGFIVKGHSILRDAQTGEAKLIWEKTTADAKAREEALAEAIEALKEELPREEKVSKPTKCRDDLITLYPVSDHHLGMLAWGEETGGDDYDLGISERLLCRSVDYLVSRSPDSSEAAIMVLGDLLHSDGFDPLTPANKNILDVDTRYPKVVRAAIRGLRYIVRSALKKHERVRLIIEIGNHDPSSAIFLMEAFAVIYEDEPRITVDTSPRRFHCFTFGKNLVATHHGHSVKLDKLPLLIATDWAKEWGTTEHRFIHTGHVHHDSAREFTGAIVESHGVLAPIDAYAAHNGYRARKSMKSIILHKEHGELGRNIVSPEMLKND